MKETQHKNQTTSSNACCDYLFNSVLINKFCNGVFGVFNGILYSSSMIRDSIAYNISERYNDNKNVPNFNQSAGIGTLIFCSIVLIAITFPTAIKYYEKRQKLISDTSRDKTERVSWNEGRTYVALIGCLAKALTPAVKLVLIADAFKITRNASLPIAGILLYATAHAQFSILATKKEPGKSQWDVLFDFSTPESRWAFGFALPNAALYFIGCNLTGLFKSDDTLATTFSYIITIPLYAVLMSSNKIAYTDRIRRYADFYTCDTDLPKRSYVRNRLILLVITLFSFLATILISSSCKIPYIHLLGFALAPAAFAAPLAFGDKKIVHAIKKSIKCENTFYILVSFLKAFGVGLTLSLLLHHFNSAISVLDSSAIGTPAGLFCMPFIFVGEANVYCTDDSKTTRQPLSQQEQ